MDEEAIARAGLQSQRKKGKNVKQRVLKSVRIEQARDRIWKEPRYLSQCEATALNMETGVVLRLERNNIFFHFYNVHIVCGPSHYITAFSRYAKA
jgi:hypothetical protein